LQVDKDDEKNHPHLLIQPIAQLGNAALDLVELDGLLLAVSLYDVHDVVRCDGGEKNDMLCFVLVLLFSVR
jgi:hypothetical protein